MTENIEPRQMPEFIEQLNDDVLNDSVKNCTADVHSQSLKEHESQHIKRWRKHAKRDHASSEKLTGLAISGGGIRSATFALGVMQSLAKADLLKNMDYLSTVSGGGYIGSALTWLVQRNPEQGFGLGPNTFPYGTDHPNGREGHASNTKQDKMLKFLRQHGKYLIPGNGITMTSLIAVLLRGMVLNLLVWLPLLITFMLSLFWLSGLKPGVEIADGTIPKLFDWSLWLAGILSIMFVFLSVFYSLRTMHGRATSSRRYRARRRFENGIRYLLWGTVLALLVASLPYVEAWLEGKVEESSGLALMLSGVVSGIWTYLKSSNKEGGVPLGWVAMLGSALFIYGILVITYLMAFDVYSHSDHWAAMGVAFVVSIITGLVVNLNYISLHRYYRDRLMETFMPNVDHALANATMPADQADHARMHPHPLKGSNLQCYPPTGPYHIVNNNVVLVDSEVRKYRIRGGDSFILSPYYCGSNATGWSRTDLFMKNNMTMATAMAISGAAANPNTGVGGVGLTRNPFVSLLMAFLNLRLGYWAPNPDKKKCTWHSPNHFDAAWYEIKPDGYAENKRFIQLSDGGHFENLGLYELIRRQCKLIIVSDGAADPDFDFGDLQNAVRRVRADFGVVIDFNEDNHPRDLIPHDDLSAGYPRHVKLAKRGYIVGTITYPDQSTGSLIYIKTTIIEGLSLELLGYKSAHSDFPDESTADQFFDEDQFEAYRELGYSIAETLDHDLIRSQLA